MTTSKGTGDALKVKQGDPLSAERWNSLVDSLQKPGQGTGQALAAMNRSLVRIRNKTGADRDMGELVALDAWDGPNDGDIYTVPGAYAVDALEPEEKTPWFKLALMVAPVPDGETGWAVVNGLAMAKVNYQQGAEQTDPEHTHLAFDTSQTPTATIPVTTEGTGFASIIQFVDPETAEDDPSWAVVNIGVGAEAQIIYAEVDAEVESFAKYTVTAKTAFSGSLPDPAEFELDMSDQPAFIQPMVGDPEGFSGNGKDSLILKRGVPEGPDKPGAWRWIGTNGFIARGVNGSFSVPKQTPAGDVDVTVTVSKFWEGYDPGTEVPAVFTVPDLLAECEQDQTMTGDMVWQPENRKYKIITTDAALLGTPRTSTVAKSGTTQHNSESTDPGLCYQAETVEVVSFGCDETAGGGDPPKENQFCFGDELCDHINEECDPYSKPDPEGCTTAFCGTLLSVGGNGGGNPSHPTPNAVWFEQGVGNTFFGWPDGVGFTGDGADVPPTPSGNGCVFTFPIQYTDEGQLGNQSTLTLRLYPKPGSENTITVAEIQYTQEWDGGNQSREIIGTDQFPCDSPPVAISTFQVSELEFFTLDGGFWFNYAALLAMSSTSSITVQPGGHTEPLGTRFEQAWPELFKTKSCSCSDAIRLLNSWDGRMSESRLKRVVSMIHKRNPDIDRAEIESAIRGLMT